MSYTDKDGLKNEILSEIPEGSVPQEVLDSIAGKVDKITGSSLVPDSEISKIHEPGSDDQDLSNLVVKETGKGLSVNDLTSALKTGYDNAVTHAGSTHYGYVINVQALTSSPADSQTVYFGMLPKAPITTANVSKVYIRKAGTIKIAEIYCYSGTAGTAEAWSLYIRKNNSADTLIATLSVNTNERVFSNAGLNIAVAVGDYIEIKGVQPLWATNPATCIYGGYIYIE